MKTIWIACLVALMGLAGCGQKSQQTDSGVAATPKEGETPVMQTSSKALSKPASEAIDATKKVKLTYMAVCQMKCNKISVKEVKDALKSGKALYNESWMNAKPCPYYLVEGADKAGNKIQIVVSTCDAANKIVRVNGGQRKNCGCDQERFNKKAAPTAG